MLHNKRISRAISTITLLAILLAACSLPSPNNSSTSSAQLTPEPLITSAVKTVIAQLTIAAFTPGASGSSATEPAAPVVPPSQAPATPAVIQGTTALSPSQTPQPSPTPTKAKATATIRPSSTTSSTDPKLGLGDPTFSDKFSSDKNWVLSADKHTDMYIKDGKLVMTAFTTNQWDGWALTWPKTTNFYLEMTATTQTCGGLDRYGLMVRSKQDASVGYLFGFSCDGHYSFRKWDGVKIYKIRGLDEKQLYPEWLQSNQSSRRPG